MDNPILRLEDVVKAYNIKSLALNGINLTMAAGEFTALIGPSGSGKSTLLNLIGLLDRPSAGRITLTGVDTGPLDDRALTRLRGETLGFVFQFHHLLPAFTAIENVLLPTYGDRNYMDDALRTKAMRLLEAVGLADRVHHRSNELSGGEQQRVAIARALSRDPKLVLADEPTGNLDSASANEVFDLLRRFNREQGTTFLVVTHDPGIAHRCDRIVEMIDGQIHGDKKPGTPSMPIRA
jgi:lipoprotein-releasing system ATP-binding protein